MGLNMKRYNRHRLSQMIAHEKQPFDATPFLALGTGVVVSGIFSIFLIHSAVKAVDLIPKPPPPPPIPWSQQWDEGDTTVDGPEMIFSPEKAAEILGVSPPVKAGCRGCGPSRYEDHPTWDENHEVQWDRRIRR